MMTGIFEVIKLGVYWPNHPQAREIIGRGRIYYASQEKASQSLTDEDLTLVCAIQKEDVKDDAPKP